MHIRMHAHIPYASPSSNILLPCKKQCNFLKLLMFCVGARTSHISQPGKAHPNFDSTTLDSFGMKGRAIIHHYYQHQKNHVFCAGINMKNLFWGLQNLVLLSTRLASLVFICLCAKTPAHPIRWTRVVASYSPAKVFQASRMRNVQMVLLWKYTYNGILKDCCAWF